ncbi:MAG: hypothetical protein CMI30_06075 [Opitutae bacterium]|nr:hypothetical protein [Opitutae bacterium]
MRNAFQTIEAVFIALNKLRAQFKSSFPVIGVTGFYPLIYPSCVCRSKSWTGTLAEHDRIYRWPKCLFEVRLQNVMKKLLFVLSSLILICGCQTPANFGGTEEKVYRKKNLEILLPGKNQQEVIELMGPPQSYSEDPSGRIITLEYRKEVLDQATGLTFYLTRIWVTFERGICVEVQVELQ